MTSLIQKYFKQCPKTEKIIGLKTPDNARRLLIPLIGLAAIAWILFRVITKPSRITYPCVRVAMPVASSFIAYFVVPALAIFAWFRARKNQVAATALFAVAGLGGTFVLDDVFETKEDKLATIVQPANEPMGDAVGIFPGRVVWVHNPNATNENWTSTTSNGWFLPANNNQIVIDGMVSSAIQNLTGKATDSAAWKAIFEFHNDKMRNKGAVNYSPGEKIFIKINVVSGWDGNFSTNNLSKNNTNSGTYNITETSPAIVLAVLRQLVNVVGVTQNNIYVGDPLRHIYKHCYDLWHSEFPDVHYLDYSGYTNLGREKVVVSPTARIYYSDRGTVLLNNTNSAFGTNPIYKDTLYTVFEDVEYMINLPMLKGHKRAGVTMFAKNHFGSHKRSGAAHLHNGLIAPVENLTYPHPLANRQGYGLYRVQADIMSHSLLGRKNLVYLMDALWATDYELDIPLKWQMAPFNNDWMSSVFASFDPVAIESVGYDFLRSEFTSSRVPAAGTYVQMSGVDDYLHQVADSLNWPAGVRYDPDSTGTFVKSLGVHEHWNDASNKQYSRNLNSGDGIELVKAGGGLFAGDREDILPNGTILCQNYPNPFNPSTNFEYRIDNSGFVTLKIYDVLGREVATLVNEEKPIGIYKVQWDASQFTSGVYFYKMQTGNYSETKKMIYQK